MDNNEQEPSYSAHDMTGAAADGFRDARAAMIGALNLAREFAAGFHGMSRNNAENLADELLDVLNAAIADSGAAVPDGRSSAARTAGGRLDVLLRAVEKYGKASLTLGGSPLSKREYYDAQTRRDLAWKEAETVAKSMAEDLLMLAPEQRAVSEDVRRDAERYRWLRDEAICFPYDMEIESAWCVFGLNCSGSDPRPIEGRELDEAIDAARRFAETDAAMAAQPQGEEKSR